MGNQKRTVSRRRRKTHMKNKQTTILFCAYCGIKPGVEKGHVFSRALFPKPRPSNLLTVPACPSCNRRLGEYENEFRDVLVADYRTNQHLAATDLIDTVLRSAVRGRSEIIKGFLHHGESVLLNTKSGLCIGKYRRLSVKTDWIKYVLGMMVRALYFYHFERVVPETCEIVIDLVDSLKIDLTIEFIRQSPFNLSDPQSLGNNVVNWAYSRLSEEDVIPIVWLMSFYDNFFVVAIIKELDEILPLAL